MTLIETETAKERLRRWIQDCTLIGDSQSADLYRDFIDFIDKQPTVEPPVRCRDCKYYSASTMKCFKPVDDEHTFHDYAAPIWKPDDYCSYGARMDAEEGTGE